MADLTDRELAILRCYAAGRTRSQTGRELGLTRSSVETYSSRLFAKLDAATEAQAVHHAHQRGLLDGTGQPEPPAAPAAPVRRVWDNPDLTRRRRAVLDQALHGREAA